MQPIFKALPSDDVARLRAGGKDAFGLTPERAISDGQGTPCRHCLCHVPKGKGMLILAHRPFENLHAYAETGPIFLCADDCERAVDGAQSPAIMADTESYLIKGYSQDERIVYGTGAVVPTAQVSARCAQIFDDPNVAFIHVRSSRNNCYQMRVERG